MTVWHGQGSKTITVKFKMHSFYNSALTYMDTIFTCLPCFNCNPNQTFQTFALKRDSWDQHSLPNMNGWRDWGRIYLAGCSLLLRSFLHENPVTFIYLFQEILSKPTCPWALLMQQRTQFLKNLRILSICISGSEYFHQVWAVRHLDSQTNTQCVIFELLISHHCRAQHDLGLAILCLKLSVGEKMLRDNYLVCPQEVWLVEEKLSKRDQRRRVHTEVHLRAL